MARLFSIKFSYKQQEHSALVTISGSGSDTTIAIGAPAGKQHSRLLPERIVLNGDKQLQQVGTKQHIDKQLLEVLVKEVEKHEKGVPERGLWD